MSKGPGFYGNNDHITNGDSGRLIIQLFTFLKNEYQCR